MGQWGQGERVILGKVSTPETPRSQKAMSEKKQTGLESWTASDANLQDTGESLVNKDEGAYSEGVQQ